MKFFDVTIRGGIYSEVKISEEILNDCLIILLEKELRLTDAYDGEIFFLDGKDILVSILIAEKDSLREEVGVREIERLIDLVY